MEVNEWIDLRREDALYHAAYKTLSELSKDSKHFGAKIGYICILPKGFVRIRYYGLLACRCKTQKMTLCRNLLGCKKYISKLRGKTTAEKIQILYKHDICKCSKCGEPLITFRMDGRYMLC